MVSHVWYLTKFLQLSVGVAFAAGSMMLLSSRLHVTTENGRMGVSDLRRSVQRKEIRALPVTLPHGRLYCVDGMVMHERMSPQRFEQVSPSDAVEVLASVADRACERSHQAAACKAAQGDLTALRRAIRGCRA